MAEEGSVYELEGLEEQLESLLSRFSGDELIDDSKPFCSDFCKLVEEYASRWQVPLPQLRILEIALSYFARASCFLTTNCDHVLHTLSSLALSVFELLLFFDQKDFHQEPLKHFSDTFQECHHLALAKHQNVHLLQVERLVQGGGPWAGQALQAILSQSSLPQSEVDGCISSELPVFFELRVRYLLSCERVSEALALAKCCAQHPTAGQHLFFLQVYLTWLIKTSQHDRLHKEVAEFNGKDAIHIICSLECEEKDELLLDLSRAFLSQQLRRGDMYYLCDLVLIWSKLHSRMSTSKQALLEDSHQLMLSATNVNSIFPFIRAILQELGEDGIQFCVELCANALRSCLPCDIITKSLIYKTIAGLLPNDLEVARACALLVFFLERTVETYKMVYLLYMQPDQEYHVEYSPIGNHVRFETLQVLKKDLYFDPEFWNLIALRTNCLKLMSEKGVNAALEEVMEDKWILSYCTKESASQSRTPVCQKGSKGAKRRHHKEDTDAASKRLKFGPGKTRLNVDHTVKKKGNHGSRPLKNVSSEPLRRSFWQLDRLRDNVAVGYGELRRTTRLSEKNPPKRRIIKPKWLLEDSGTLGESNVHPKIKKHGLKHHQKHHRSSEEKRSETDGLNNNAKHKPPIISHLRTREINSKQQKGFLLDSPKPGPAPQVILELSLPDNELMGTFPEDSCNRQRGFPQVLLYRPTVKVPSTSQPVKTVHRKEVILRARDAAMFVQQLHCYIRRQKGKGNGPNIQGSVSTITRSSVQGSPPKDPQSRRCERTVAGMKRRVTLQTAAAAEVKKSTASEKVLQTQATKAVSQKASSGTELSEKSAAKVKVKVSQTSAARDVTEAPMRDKVLQGPPIASVKELCEESAVEMKVTIASTAAKVTQSPGLGEVTKAVKDITKTPASPEVLQTSTVFNNHVVVTDSPESNKANILNIGASNLMPSQSQNVCRDRNQEVLETGKNPVAHAETDPPEVLSAVCSNLSEVDVSPKLSKGPMPCQNDTSRETMITTCTPTDQNSLNDISALTLVTEMVAELTPEALTRDLENHKPLAPEDSSSKESTAESKCKGPCKLGTTSACSVVPDVQLEEEGTQEFDSEAAENSKLPEPEESKLEYCCTFCNKDFKGSRVVAHAMFHYRKDECMFCGTIFKDDLLAMMHLSDHIEKLKRSKDLAENNAQENTISGTKDIATHKTPAKAKNTDVSPGHRGRGRPRKSTDCLKSLSLPDTTPLASRKLRSNNKPVDGESLHEKKHKISKHLNSKTPLHKVNGHTGKKKELKRLKKGRSHLEVQRPHTQRDVSHKSTNEVVKKERLQPNQDTEMCSSATLAKADKVFRCSSEDKMKETQSPHVLKTTTKQIGKVVEKNLEPQEKLCCPVEGCAWFTDLAKNRVALLYHALEDHDGEVKPLELAFQVGNSRCSCCMRVMWSFEHFQHHVERHRLTPRHPCLHLGCAARFKSGMEMRRHARRHSPLQAVCCLPGCSQLFICLWALNLHEREHYTSNPTKPENNTNEQTGDEHDSLSDGKKQPDHNPMDAATVNKTLNADRKLKSPPTTVRASLLDSHVLKNLSNKDTSTEPPGPNLRLRQTIRKVTNTTTKGHKVISSSLPKHNIKVRHRFKKKQVIINKIGSNRRGCPPKSKKTVHDENTTTGPNKTVKEETVQLAVPSEAENVSEESKEERSQQVKDDLKTTETLQDKSESKKQINKQVTKNHIKHKRITRHASTETSLNQSAGPKMQKLNKDKTKKLHPGTKISCSKKDSSQTASSDPSKTKKVKVTNSKSNAKIKKKVALNEPRSSSPPRSDVSHVEAKAAAGVEIAADNEGNAKAENTDTAQSSSSNSVPVALASSVNETPATPTTSQDILQVTTGEKSKQSNVNTEGETEQTAPPSDSGKTNKKHKVINNKGDKKTPKGPLRKDANQTTALKKKSKSKPVDKQLVVKAAAESAPDGEGKAKEEMTDSTLDSSASSIPKKEKPKKSNVVKNSDPNKANKKRKNVHKEGDAKIIKKRRKDEEEKKKKPAKTGTNVQPPAEVKAEVVNGTSAQEGKTSLETPQPAMNSSGYSLITNGQASREDVKATVLKQTLEMYSKKPYMRPPPTAYLDEKYITMPKRRKELTFLQSSQRSPPPQQIHVTAALQRQRCANCFATFNSAEELQSHLQLKKCSNIFGFDSDDEGDSFLLKSSAKVEHD